MSRSLMSRSMSAGLIFTSGDAVVKHDFSFEEIAELL